MLPSHESLDRPGGFSRVRLLAPLRHRDFRLLWGGMCISLVGDGVFLVAMAWQVYALSNVPTALSTVGIAMTVPTIAFLLLGGVVSDRFDRRRVILASDLGRAAAVGLIAVLAVGGWLQLWHIVVLAAVYGTGTGFFAPAFDSIVPELLPSEELGQANSLDQFARPLALRLAGPALGGVLIAAGGSGFAFAVDAASFLASAGGVLAMTPGRKAARRSGRGEIGAAPAGGIRYGPRHRWVWGSLKQRKVPTALLGRVSSLDWLISIGLLPLSLALTGPVSAAIGVRTTLVCAGVVGGLVTLGALWLPGMRALERNERGLPESGVFASSSSS